MGFVYGCMVSPIHDMSTGILRNVKGNRGRRGGSHRLANKTSYSARRAVLAISEADPRTRPSSGVGGLAGALEFGSEHEHEHEHRFAEHEQERSQVKGLRL